MQLTTTYSDSYRVHFTTEYGEFEISEPIIQELVCHDAMQRLKKIRQYGPRYYVIKKEDYTRFDHSLGVYFLLRKYGAPLQEQIAGLLHDISHTVFSHVADHLFNIDHAGNSYQDMIHKEFLSAVGIDTVLKKYGLQIDDILHKKSAFTALEQPLPDLCADRLEYNLKGGLLEGLLTQDDLAVILKDLSFENNNWIFRSIQSAKKFASVPLYLTEHVWGSADSLVMYKWTADALQRALALQLLSYDDIHYSYDDYVWQILCNADDTCLKEIMHKIHNCQTSITTGHYPCDTIIKTKFRGVDPWVKTGNNSIRLTDLDAEFKKDFYEVKKRVEHGWAVTFLCNNP